MKKYKVGKYVFLSAIGFVVFGVGLALVKLLPDREGILKTLPFLCVGVGTGVFGGNLSAAVASKTLKDNPQAAKRVEIEQKDERNQIISSMAKARAYDLMIYVYAAILLTFALVQVDMYIILTLVAVYLVFIFTNAYYRIKYYKEM